MEYFPKNLTLQADGSRCTVRSLVMANNPSVSFPVPVRGDIPLVRPREARRRVRHGGAAGAERRLDVDVAPIQVCHVIVKKPIY